MVEVRVFTWFRGVFSCVGVASSAISMLVRPRVNSFGGGMPSEKGLVFVIRGVSKSRFSATVFLYVGP